MMKSGFQPFTRLATASSLAAPTASSAAAPKSPMMPITTDSERAEPDKRMTRETLRSHLKAGHRHSGSEQMSRIVTTIRRRGSNRGGDKLRDRNTSNVSQMRGGRQRAPKRLKNVLTQ